MLGHVWMYRTTAHWADSAWAACQIPLIGSSRCSSGPTSHCMHEQKWLILCCSLQPTQHAHLADAAGAASQTLLSAGQGPEVLPCLNACISKSSSLYSSQLSSAYLGDAAGCLQEVAGLNGGVRVVGPGLPALALVLHRLAQRREGLLVAPLLQFKFEIQFKFSNTKCGTKKVRERRVNPCTK